LWASGWIAFCGGLGTWNLEMIKSLRTEEQVHTNNCGTHHPNNCSRPRLKVERSESWNVFQHFSDLGGQRCDRPSVRPGTASSAGMATCEPSSIRLLLSSLVLLLLLLPLSSTNLAGGSHALPKRHAMASPTDSEDGATAPRMAVLSGSVTARPSAAQQLYMDDQVGALISFNMVTFTGASEASCPGGNPDTQSVPPVDTFNPTSLDTDQWVASARAFGARHIYLGEDLD
jgi:hypothetical protein